MSCSGIQAVNSIWSCPSSNNSNCLSKFFWFIAPARWRQNPLRPSRFRMSVTFAFALRIPAKKTSSSLILFLFVVFASWKMAEAADDVIALHWPLQYDGGTWPSFHDSRHTKYFPVNENRSKWIILPLRHRIAWCVVGKESIIVVIFFKSKSVSSSVNVVYAYLSVQWSFKNWYPRKVFVGRFS